MVTLTQGQVLGSLGNVFCGSWFFTASAVVAFTVNKVTHQIFNLHKDSAASYIATACSFTAVLVVSAYLAPGAFITAFNGRQVMEMGLISGLAAYFFSADGVFELFASGAVIGWMGHCLPSCLGAGFGSIAGHESAHQAFDAT